MFYIYICLNQIKKNRKIQIILYYVKLKLKKTYKRIFHL